MNFGIRIFYSNLMDNPEIVVRTWKERLFTRPWNPRQKIKTIHRPYMAIINGDLYAHPTMKEQIENIKESF